MPIPTPHDAAELRRIIKKVDSLRAPGLSNTSDAISQNRPQRKQAGPPNQRRPEIYAGKLSSNAVGKAKYNGRTVVSPPTVDISSTTDLAEDDLGTFSSDEDCLVLNLPELGFSVTGHDVTAAANKFSVYFIGRLLKINSNGIKVIEAMEFFASC